MNAHILVYYATMAIDCERYGYHRSARMWLKLFKQEAGA